jgi:uncharacterized protein
MSPGASALNKTNHPPAGVLGIGIEAFLPPGSYVPDVKRPVRTPSFVEKSLAAATRWYAGLADVAKQSQPGLLLSSFRQRTDWSGRWYKRSVTGLKYLIRAACMPLRHGRFLSFIAEHQALRIYRRRDPRLMERHMHRFVNAHWHRRQRLAYLHQHYRFALAHLPSSLFDLVYALGHASLGSLTAKDGSLLTLCLRPPIFKGCEGELCLQLCDAHENPLYSIVFTVSDRDASIMIGCLQGPRGDNAREVVRELTRNMHGMRPKQLMLSLVYAFARHYDITKLLAISNDAHPLRRTGRPLLSDYDAFWQEQHGKPVEDGWYALPPVQVHKSEAEVPSHHRSAFRRREALRRQAEQLLLNALEQPAPRLPEHPPQALRAAAGRPSPGFRVEASWVS